MKRTHLLLAGVMLTLGLFIAFAVSASDQCPEGYSFDDRTGKCIKCPEGQWFDSQRRRCVTPGDGDPAVDRAFIEQLKAECHFPCGDGWCCRETRHCQECLRESGRSRNQCYRRLECWRKR